MTEKLSSRTFTDLQQFIHTRLGLHFPENKKYLLETRLQARLAALECGTFEAYYQYLQHDPDAAVERANLANCITTNETYFFRDHEQLECVRRHLFPQLVQLRTPRRRLRIWSAGCSSGEEAYTLAMILAEEFRVSLWAIEILATDVSEHILQQAHAGIYGQYSVRNVPPAWLKKYFQCADGQYTITPELRRWVKFSALNLFDASQMRAMRGVDLILCRNVLIYFDDDGRKQIVSGFHQSLARGGALMIGSSESLQGLAHPFHAVPWEKTMLYYHDNGVPGACAGAVS